MKTTLYITCGVVLVLLVLWTIWGNTAIVTTTFTIQSAQLPASFAGFRIVQVSDLHSAKFGKDNCRLLDKLRQAQPDLIAITGDIVNARHLDLEPALEFVREAVKIAPCYYVPGNHEGRIRQYTTLQAGLMEAGVTVLRNEAVELERGGSTVTLLGLDDPRFWGLGYTAKVRGEKAGAKLAELTESIDGFSVLLSHRPELFDTYCKCGIDLALTGHVHGGQFRLPFIGGLYGPDQGILPEYDAGLYTSGCTHMVLSRGLGNSAFPIRFNNPPELVVIELQR